MTAPRVIFEVLSPSTRESDLRVKKEEYRTLGTVDTIVFADPEAERIMISQRHGEDWVDTPFTTNDVSLPSLGIGIPHAEIFARD